MLTEQQIRTARGALYLIDHVGTPPKGANFRLFTNQAIEKHLERHSYYYYQRNQQSDPAHRKLVTMPWMRQHFLGLFRKTNRQFYEPRVPGDDTTDMLLRKGSTRGFPDSVLSTYRYDRATFSESDLPPYEGDVDEDTSDSDAIEVAEKDAIDSGQQRTARKSTETAADPPSSFYQNSTQAFDGTENIDGDANSKENDDELDNDEDDGSYIDENDEIYHPGKMSTGILDESDSTVAQLKQKSSRLPRKQSDNASKSVPRSSMSAIASGTAISGKAGRAIAESRGPIAAKSDRGFQSNIERQTDTTKAPRKDMSRKKNDEPSIQSKSTTSSSAATAQLGKRKRQDDDLVTQASSTADESLFEAKKCRLADATVSRGAKARRPSHLLPVAADTSTETSEPKSDAPAPTPSPITPREKHSDDAKAVMDEVQDSQSTEHGYTSPHSKSRDQPAEVDNDTFDLNNEDLYQMLKSATDKIIASIGDISQCLSFLDERPSGRLEALYSRCLGPNWKAVRRKLTKDYAFIVDEVTMSVIAAYLFDNVLNQRTLVAGIRAKQLELRGPEGRAILKILDLENKEHEFRQATRTIEGEDARALLAQDHASVANNLHREAQMFTRDLWGIIQPHFRSLSRLARGLGLASNLNERSWQETFEETITELIEAVLRYRLGLLASGRDHVHTWPATEDAYDLREMEIFGAKMIPPLQVLFTIFPGTKSGSNATSMRARQGAKAKVKVQNR